MQIWVKGTRDGLEALEDLFRDARMDGDAERPNGGCSWHVMMVDELDDGGLLNVAFTLDNSPGEWSGDMLAEPQHDWRWGLRARLRRLLAKLWVRAVVKPKRAAR